MPICKFLVHQTETLASKEIETIMQTVLGEKNETLKENAEQIVRSYIKINEVINPITLARSSFYIALKEMYPDPESKVKMIINNNGKTNKWWMHLVPVIEKQLKNI